MTPEEILTAVTINPACGIGRGNEVGTLEIGKKAGEAAKAAGITKVVFDRNGAVYHGKVKALADAARETGLVF